MTLTGGWAYGSIGGAVYNQGTLTLSNGSRVSDNMAGAGGGIYNNGGTLTVMSGTLDKAVNSDNEQVYLSESAAYGVSGTGVRAARSR